MRYFKVNTLGNHLDGNRPIIKTVPNSFKKWNQCMMLREPVEVNYPTNVRFNLDENTEIKIPYLLGNELHYLIKIKVL
ncbi:hypothetical protein [Flavivirga eckloniae]|uniref:Uncharacterized protein n=1 Tax=Flavivirga eckloniae TaxID=1803846 RepID=A0A2K9PPG9_9FLAO|nr:hypothetical protein [Flavivirga eckloniae]AUP78952.1 hypothetical protein C1H87_09670 [Flavivirga eckloniae]